MFDFNAFIEDVMVIAARRLFVQPRRLRPGYYVGVRDALGVRLVVHPKVPVEHCATIVGIARCFSDVVGQRCHNRWRAYSDADVHNNTHDAPSSEKM